MSVTEFSAMMLSRDGSVRSGAIKIRAAGDGFVVQRPELPDLVLGPGYRLLRTISCGVCATDLARPFMSFDLPQVVGHEVLAEDESGQRVVIEINASCLARRLPEICQRCREGLPTHCERRLTLGINDLPGGFGPNVLAPGAAIIPVPEQVSNDTAVLMEPFAAALRAVEACDLLNAQSVAVLGPRRLGMLLIAALAAERRAGRHAAKIRAWLRRMELGDLARDLGADAVELSDAAELEPADIVFETSGNPKALLLALEMARSELHLKSTHGRESAGLEELTAFVVDELAIERLPRAQSLPRSPSGLLELRRDELRLLDASDWPEVAANDRPAGTLLVAQDDAAIDAAIRPQKTSEASLLSPRETLFLDPGGSWQGALSRTVVERGLRVSSSRCGDFVPALQRIVNDPELQKLGAKMVSHRFGQRDLAKAFAMAASKEALKVVVDR